MTKLSHRDRLARKWGIVFSLQRVFPFLGIVPEMPGDVSSSQIFRKSEAVEKFPSVAPAANLKLACHSQHAYLRVSVIHLFVHFCSTEFKK